MATGDGIGKQSIARGQILINFSFSNDCVAHRGVVVVVVVTGPQVGVVLASAFILSLAGVVCCLAAPVALCGLFDDESPPLLIMLCM